MKITTRKKSNLAVQVASMGLPPLRAGDAFVELSIQECEAKTRRVIENFPADRIPNVGDEIKSERRVGRIPDAFVVMEVKHLPFLARRKHAGPFYSLSRKRITSDSISGQLPQAMGFQIRRKEGSTPSLIQVK